jgi:hypothetical protein
VKREDVKREDVKREDVKREDVKREDVKREDVKREMPVGERPKLISFGLHCATDFAVGPALAGGHGERQADDLGAQDQAMVERPITENVTPLVVPVA